MWAYFSIIIESIAVVITTVVFCFWCIYLLETIKIKWSIYTRANSYPQGGYSYQQHLEYNAKTKLMKYVTLFVMNLVEWLAFTIIRTVSILKFVADNAVYGNGDTAFRTHVYSSELVNNFHMLGKSLIVLSTVLFACLCRYLSARYSPESWINSKGIPQLICIFAVYSVVNQIITALSPIIAKWFITFLLTSSIILAMKELRKLINVVDRTIVDLQISRINVRLLKRQVSTRRTLNRMKIILCVGTVLVLLSEYIENALTTCTALISYEQEANNHILSSDVHIPISNEVVKLITDLAYIICLIGTACIFIPYVLYGVSTMYLVIWRLIRGKTGYRTHFKGHF